MAIGDVYSARLVGMVALQQVECVTHWKMLSGADPGPTIGAFVKTEMMDVFVSNQLDDFTWNVVQVRRLSIPQIGSDYVTGLPEPGGQPRGTIDPRTSLVASLRTPSLGKSYRGRMYLPSVDYGSGSTGIFSAAVVAALQTDFDDLVAAVGVGGANTDIAWGVWSAKLGNIYTPDADLEGGQKLTGYDWTLGFQPISSVIVNPEMFTQRRRGINIRIRD